MTGGLSVQCTEPDAEGIWLGTHELEHEKEDAINIGMPCDDELCRDQGVRDSSGRIQRIS